MTAINVIITDEQAVIVSDTRGKSAVGPDFDVAKVMPVPHMCLAVATRGRMDTLMKVVGAICVGAFSYDSARSFMAEAYERLGLDDAEVIVAGWSDKGPAAFIISKANTAGKVLDIQHVLVTPTVRQDLAEAFAVDPIGQMRAVINAQAMKTDAVGGWINVTQVGQTVIETYTAGRIGHA